MIAGSLEIQLMADMSRLAQDLEKAKRMTGDSMGAMETSMGRVEKGIVAITTAEKERASIFARTMAETRRLFGISVQAVEENSKAVKQLKEDYEENLKVPASAFASLALYREKAAYAIGAGVAMGIDKAKEWWEQFNEWVKEKAKTTAVIWGAAIVTGIAATVLTGLYAAYKAIGFGVGLLTGESYKSANIDAVIALNKEVQTLQENLPLTAVGASALNEALKQQGTSAAGYAQTLGSVNAAQRTNGEELDRLGVKYKDQNGNLLDTKTTLASAAAVLATYASGWDREQAAAAIAMGSEKQIQDALAVTEEKIQIAKDRLVDYGLVIGAGTQAAVGEYEEAMRAFNRELDLTSNGVKKAISDNVMPILTQFAQFFREGFPTVVMAFRYSMATVMSLFYGLKTVVYMVAESIAGSMEAAWLAMTFRFDAAKKRFADIGDNIVEQARRNAEAMRLAWGADSLGADGQPSGVNSSGKKWVPKPLKPPEPPKVTDTSAKELAEYMRKWKLIEEDKERQEKAAQEVQGMKNKIGEEDLARREELRKLDITNLAAYYDALQDKAVENGQLLLKLQKEENKKMGEFAKEAARNIQRGFSDMLFDVMQGKFDNLGDRFKAMLDRMVADALAAKLASAMFGDMDKTGNIGGWIGKAIDAFGGGGGGFVGGAGSAAVDYTSGAGLESIIAGSYAAGTDYVPRTGLYKLHQGERVTPAAGNNRAPITINFTVSGPIDRRTQSQMAALAGESVQRAMARNT